MSSGTVVYPDSWNVSPSAQQNTVSGSSVKAAAMAVTSRVTKSPPYQLSGRASMSKSRVRTALPPKLNPTRGRHQREGQPGVHGGADVVAVPGQLDVLPGGHAPVELALVLVEDLVQDQVGPAAQLQRS